MENNQYKYVYGPVYSWRMGMSLGIDPISTEEKVCNFDCVYCQLGNSGVLSNDRKIFVDTQEIMKEIDKFPSENIDYFTFSGRGEPTLARNLGEMISAVKNNPDRKVAVITNSALMSDEKVRKEVALADFVLAKLDAFDVKTLSEVSRPVDGISVESIVDGLKEFKRVFGGKFALQVMFIEENKSNALEIARIAKDINPDEVQINTPLRPSGVKPLSYEDIEEIKKEFIGLNVVCVFDAEKRDFLPISEENTVLRHGKYKKI